MYVTRGLFALALLLPAQEKPVTVIGDGAGDFARLFSQMRLPGRVLG
jgi:hypothetical protein